MKTLTEFQNLVLKTAVKTKQELLQAGKTPEELPQALSEALKLEGDKFTWLMNAVDAVGTKDRDLKRVVVFSLGENEKPPQGATQMGEHYYAVEYYPPLAGQGPKDKGRRDGRPPGKGGDKKRRGKGGRGGGERDRGRGPSNAAPGSSGRS